MTPHQPGGFELISFASKLQHFLSPVSRDTGNGFYVYIYDNSLPFIQIVAIDPHRVVQCVLYALVIDARC